MPSRLTAQTLVARLREKGFSRRQIAEGINRSPSTVDRIRRGEVSGAAVREAARALSTRRVPPPRAHVTPPPSAPPPVTPPTRELPAVERVTVGPTQRAVIQQGDPNREVLLREVEGQGEQPVQVFVQFADGKQIRLFTHGGWKAERLEEAMRGNRRWLGNYLRRLGYKPGQHGGIASTQIVFL